MEGRLNENETIDREQIDNVIDPGGERFGNSRPITLHKRLGGVRRQQRIRTAINVRLLRSWHPRQGGTVVLMNEPLRNNDAVERSQINNVVNLGLLRCADLAKDRCAEDVVNDGNDRLQRQQINEVINFRAKWRLGR